ncbi:photosynthetic NDH subunit of lumenal location 3, chloroplastic [Silene latifolia]|uniref:photosynthetic NDH subunit of lumenal location 3, chloroplastic n=1 Tax=Silene latifolia TaxID=37657 RepID=UPI003D771AA6
MMSQLANLHGVIESLLPIQKLQNPQKTFTKSRKTKCHAKKLEDLEWKMQPLLSSNTSRRPMLGVASIALLAQFVGVKTSVAEEGNGLWRDGLLPGLPPFENYIGNKETGTRTFLKTGLYIANVGLKGSEYRIKKYAFDLMALGDLIGKDAWNYFRKYLKIKATIMFYDFDKLISAAAPSDKQPLTDLANRLFDNFEQLQDAVKMKDLPLTESCYRDTTVLLQEVMDRMA